MERPLKQRLVGAAVLVGLAVIFVPMLLDKSAIDEPRIEKTNIPPQPEGEFSSRIVPLEPVQPVTPITPPSVSDPAPVAEPEPQASSPEPESQAAAPSPEPEEQKAVVPDVPPAPVGDAEEAARTEARQRIGVNAWVVQLGSFASEQNARDLEKRLQKEGYAAFVEQMGAGEAQKYRVRVGPELIRAKAQDARDKLEKELNLKGIVVRYP